eukprot:30899-Pelagococcus_subviridis.AAC.18
MRARHVSAGRVHEADVSRRVGIETEGRAGGEMRREKSLRNGVHHADAVCEIERAFEHRARREHAERDAGEEELPHAAVDHDPR